MEPQPLQPKPTLTDRLRLVAQPVIDPIVTLLARLGVSPDLLTVLGFLAHFLFAYLIAIGEMRWAAVAILILAPLDALDGALSRKLNRQQGAFGAFFDSTLDRLAEIVLFGGFLFHFYQTNDQWMVALAYLAATGSLMVSYARARAESLGYEAKVGILSRVERYGVLIIFLFFSLPQIALGILALFTYITFFQRMYSVWRQSRPQE
jgi:CDP-diacylglycerol--glycerol-3-phosphate 3-phosphatidyltransferase